MPASPRRSVETGRAGPRIVLEDLDTEKYDLYSHQNEDIVRLTPEQLRQRMAEKENWPPRRRISRTGDVRCDKW